MKYIFKLMLVAFLSLTIFSCDKDEVSTDLGFNESVAMIQYGLNSTNSNSKSTDTGILIIEIKSFNSEFELNSQYYIDAIQYTDDGDFNDEIAGDGLYTSIQEVTILEKQKSTNQVDKINFSSDFKFDNELKLFLKGKYVSNSPTNGVANKVKGKIKFGCKTRLVECPETNWWNSCWPLSSPCTCVEFYDCEGSIEIEF